MKTPPVQTDDQIRVLVVDDHPIFRLGLSERVKSIGGRLVLIGEGGDGFAAQRLTAALHPHVILMDLQMPGMDGIEATQNIKRDFPEIQIIILSSDDKMEDINSALKAGASGYLLKSVTGPELQESIFTVMEGGSVLSPSVTRSLLTAMSQPVTTSESLSEREIEILKMASMGATNKKIAQDLFLSIRTVEKHIHNIFQKLGTSSRTEAVTKAIKKKIIPIPESS